MEAEMVLLVFVVEVVAGVCPLHLFLDVYSDVNIWKPQICSNLAELMERWLERSAASFRNMFTALSLLSKFILMLVFFLIEGYGFKWFKGQVTKKISK